VGQKVHPYGFRLGVINGWQSNWYAERGYTTAPQHKLETSAQVGVMLPAEQRTAMNQYVIDPKSRDYTGVLSARPGVSPNKAYHEAMAYLTESLLEGTASPEMQALAKSLTRNIR
jgi:small subunit ribosomal protein S3